MKKTKEKILKRVSKLKEVKFIEPSAMQLHGKRPLMARVERQEDRLYLQRVEKQKKDLKLKLQKIDKYQADIQKEKQRRFNILDSYHKNKELIPMENGEGPLPPVFRPIGVVVPKPVIGVPGMPVRGRVRHHGRQRLF